MLGTDQIVSVPPRHYLLAAEVFARAADSDATGVLRVALEAAAAVGRQLVAGGAEHRDVQEHLRRQGFEPYADGPTTRLRNCPFQQLARRRQGR